MIFSFGFARLARATRNQQLTTVALEADEIRLIVFFNDNHSLMKKKIIVNQKEVS